ncbi:MAG: 50S ribosomal protein L21 [bacterium]|nr:50S ribosomal protein L21 [bacterium]
MFAIVEISGKQFQVQENEELIVPKQNNEVGDSIVFDKVLLLNQDGKITVGQPMIENASVSTTVVEHGKDQKVVVFKKIRRKDYKKTVGHRQDFTKIKIESIKTS